MSENPPEKSRQAGKTSPNDSVGRAGRYFKYAIGEIILVVIGILIALQINNWNENRNKQKQSQLILQKLAVDLTKDIEYINFSMVTGQDHISDIKNCLDILSNQKEATKSEFIESFSGTLLMVGFEMNRTTFDGISESRAIDYIQNRNLVDSLSVFYNADYMGWDTAIRDYTRNIIAPYLMKFDYLPSQTYDPDLMIDDPVKLDITKFKIPQKSLEDYKSDIFIINLLTQRLYLIQGQMIAYQELKKYMEGLVTAINLEINKLQYD